MSIKLGELLLENKLITEHQLKEALHAQTIFGGKLGTNLVELGYVNELDLAKLLSTQLDIPCVQAGDFDEVDREVLKAIPLTLIKKHQVFPLALEGRVLQVAMADPTNFPAVDEICFATGLKVEPVVAPEILLVYAIEKYYDVPRQMRYIRAAGLEQNLAELSPTASSTAPVLEQVSAPPLVAEELESALSAGDDERAVEGFPIHQVVTELVRARRSVDVLEVIRSFVSQDFEYVVVFLISGDNAVGAAHVGGKLTQEEFQELSFPVNSSEILFRVWNSREHFHGLPRFSGVDDWYFSELGIPKNRPTICFPVFAEKRVICIILASENRKGELLDMMTMYKVFAKKVGLAFELLVLKNQILDLSELD